LIQQHSKEMYKKLHEIPVDVEGSDDNGWNSLET
jgi:hypothetical protein